ncbi:MAG TPA: lipoyl(octanoyl) transferase [Candidatus Sulfotelmatobacter sp.]|nr:lipoyl(octanoyl) transferase [Candidatus Sulfotelmatobacter sp.]
MISVIQLGTIDYTTGLRLQEQLVALRKENKIDDVLLLLEHKPVITLGRNAKAANVIASPELLTQRGVELYECDRGGDVTFHGPGQLVGYPIFDLRGYANSNFLSSRAEENDPLADCSLQSRDLALPPRKHLGAVDFVRRLEEVLIRTCADFTIETKRIPGLTGVWTEAESNDAHVATAASAVRPSEARPNIHAPNVLAPNVPAPDSKLAAIGIHISRSVTSHGFALNVNTDLTYFNLIIPCGITAKPVTSMQKELGKKLDMTVVAESISRNFSVVFSSRVLWVETLDALLGRAVGVPMKPPAELRQLHEEDTFWS